MAKKKYGDPEAIAAFNRENGTNFWRQDQIDTYRKENNPIRKFLNTPVKVPVASGSATTFATSGSAIPKVESTVGNELGYAAGLLTTPMLLGEIGTYGPLVGALRLGAGSAGAAGGSYVAGKAGDFADKKLGTNWIGDTGRLLGGFAGFGAGMKTTTPLIRSAATRGLTLHMPQNTFMKVRGEGFDRVFNKVNSRSSLLDGKSVVIPIKQTRVVSEGTYPLYTGPKHSVTEVVNPDGTVNPRAALRIEREVADNIPGAYRMESRLENPEWHVNDPNTWAHTRNVAQSAWTIPTPKGLTKQDQMVAALGHDFGKMVSGDGHAQSSAALIEQIFPDITEQQLTAISEHMGTPKSILGKVTKQADILNGKPAITRFVGNNGKIRLRLPSHTAEKPRELVLDPQGNNKFRVHTRTWDGDHIPAEMSGEDKNTLFNALWEELPEEAEILFPESGPGNYATRGTIAGLQRLARDSRFKPTGNGVLQYVDKDGSIKTFEGTGFKKPKPIKLISRPISEAEKLGIPKGERSNSQVLEDPQYWGYQQWNNRYNTAVESGNIEEAQRLRDLHFKQKAINNQIIDSEGNPLTLYHGNLASESQIRGMGLNPYSTERVARKSSGYFAVDDKAVADTYKLKGDTYELYGYANNPKTIDANGHSWLNVDKFKSTDHMVNEGFNNGHDAVIINNVVDYGFNTPANHPRNPFIDYVFKPGRVKLKNAIVEDGLMERIPIVKRDNFRNPDIRYKQGGTINE